MFAPMTLCGYSKLFKKVLDPRSASLVFQQGYSQEVDDIFKFYSDEQPPCDHRPLTEDDYGRFISQRAARREPALTRQITTLAYGVGRQMISLAEGMPNEEVFPFNRLEMGWTKGGALHMEGKELSTALQYLPSQGLPALLSELRAFQQDLHRPPPLQRDVIVTNGAQHGIYQALDLLLDQGDPILLTEYTYTGVHVALKPYSPEIISIPEDEHGLVPETLDAVLSDRLSRGLRMPRLIYLVPTANNPTGTTLPAHRRRQIYDLACKYDFLILEDDPYMFLNFDDEPVPSFLSLDVAGRVIRLDSLSKVVSAGLRGGWLSAPRPLLQRVELHMQAELLHSCTLAQCLLLCLISCQSFKGSHLHRARALYRRRRDALQAALAPLDSLADWSPPKGGLFLWLRVRGVDDVYNMVFETAFKRGLMLIPGQAFLYDTSAPSQHLRLTFSKIALKDMDLAARTLADIIKEEQSRSLQKQPQRLATQH
ncbi:kynurenine/alpha-aminoadipate aminotransferase, mitochondrial-like [Choristoneura fumiferana]|uniref:kynurenine/alpha-aminoadipate aminotransferase, mitochondrial-like n=1 Tax=Choristoneura fumiferana TaxID=7141 RepID=UPI003D15517C